MNYTSHRICSSVRTSPLLLSNRQAETHSFAVPRDLHFAYDVLHSCGPAPDLRNLYHMLRSQDKVLKKPRNRRRPSDMVTIPSSFRGLLSADAPRRDLARRYTISRMRS